MTAAIDISCKGCQTAKKRSQKLQVWVTCTKCGEQYLVATGAKLKDPEAGKHAMTLNRAITITGSDMTLLAKWTRRIYGKAMSIEPMIRGEGGEQQEDERVNEFHRAMVVHRFFDRLRVADRRAYEVIWFVYLERTGGTASGIGDLYGEVGKKFAPKDKRDTWERKKKNIKSPAIRNEGKQLHDNAVMLYAELKSQQRIA